MAASPPVRPGERVAGWRPRTDADQPGQSHVSGDRHHQGRRPRLLRRRGAGADPRRRQPAGHPEALGPRRGHRGRARARCSSRRTSTTRRPGWVPRAAITHKDQHQLLSAGQRPGHADLAGPDRLAGNPRAAVARGLARQRHCNPDRLVLDLDPGRGCRPGRMRGGRPAGPRPSCRTWAWTRFR